MTDGQRIKTARDRLGMSAKDLADRAGVDHQTLAALEADREVRPESVAKIEATLARIHREVGLTPIDAPTLETVVFGALADYTSDLDWIEEASGKIAAALRESGMLG